MPILMSSTYHRDFDEFLVPLGANKNALDVINQADSDHPLLPSDVLAMGYGTNRSYIKANWKRGKGWADGSAHPHCGIVLDSSVQIGHPKIRKDDRHVWIGDRFAHHVQPFDVGQKMNLGELYECAAVIRHICVLAY